MSSHAADDIPRMHFSPRASRILLCLIVTLHIFAVFATYWAVPLGGEVTALLVSCLIISCVLQLHVWRCSRSALAVHFTIYQSGLVRSASRAGLDEVTGQLMAGTLWPWILFLRWLPMGAKHEQSLLIVCDSVDKKTYRQLSVLLHHLRLAHLGQ